MHQELPAAPENQAKTGQVLVLDPENRRFRAGPQRLAPGQNRAIEALLTSKSITAAAHKAGVGVRSLSRWLHENQAFQQRLHEASRQALGQTVHRLQFASFDAANALLEMTNDSSLANTPRVLAARTILEFAFRSTEAGKPNI